MLNAPSGRPEAVAVPFFSPTFLMHKHFGSATPFAAHIHASCRRLGYLHAADGMIGGVGHR